jgi:Ca2+-binding EF-hand superfamily protein
MVIETETRNDSDTAINAPSIAEFQEAIKCLDKKQLDPTTKKFVSLVERLAIEDNDNPQKLENAERNAVLRILEDGLNTRKAEDLFAEMQRDGGEINAVPFRTFSKFLDNIAVAAKKEDDLDYFFPNKDQEYEGKNRVDTFKDILTGFHKQKILPPPLVNLLGMFNTGDAVLGLVFGKTVNDFVNEYFDTPEGKARLQDGIDGVKSKIKDNPASARFFESAEKLAKLVSAGLDAGEKVPGVGSIIKAFRPEDYELGNDDNTSKAPPKKRPQSPGY